MAIERLDPRLAAHRVLYTEHIVRYLFASPFARGKRVLDAGSGEGYGVSVLARGGAASVVGVEIDPDAAMRAHYRYARERTAYLAADATRLPFRDGSFDIVTCFEVIEHINAERQRELLREFRRVLAPDGVLIVSTPNRELYTPRVSAQVLGLNPFHAHELTPEGFRQVLASRFDHVALLGQTPVPELLLGEDGPRRDDRWYQAIDDTLYTVYRDGGDVAVTGRLARPLAPERSLYMIAVCGHAPWERRDAERDTVPTVDLSHAELLVFALWARWEVFQQRTLDWLRDKNASLEQTVIERTEWSRALEEALTRATLSVDSLQHDRANAQGLLTAAEERTRRHDAALQRLGEELQRLGMEVADREELRRVNDRLRDEIQRAHAERETRALAGELQMREMKSYVETLERALAEKNQHIASLGEYARGLEGTLRDLEGTLSTRLFQCLRAIRGR